MIKKFCPKTLKCTVIQKKCIFCDKQVLFLGTSSVSARGFLKKTAPGFPGTVSYSMRIAVKSAEEVLLFFSFHLGSSGFHGVPQFLFNHPVFAQSVGVQPVFFNAHFHEPFFQGVRTFFGYLLVDGFSSRVVRISADVDFHVRIFLQGLCDGKEFAGILVGIQFPLAPFEVHGRQFRQSFADHHFRRFLRNGLFM